MEQRRGILALSAVEKAATGVVTAQTKALLRQLTHQRKEQRVLDGRAQIARFAAELSAAACNKHQKDFWQLLNRFTGRGNSASAIKFIRAADDSLVVDKDAVVEAFTKHFELVFNPEAELDPSFYDTLREMDSAARVSEVDPEPPSRDLVIKAVRAQANGKSPDEHGACAELAKAALASNSFLDTLHAMLVEAWEQRGISAVSKRALLVPIFKRKGDAAQCTNYRGITLLSFFRRLFAWLVFHHLQSRLEEAMPDTQAGGRPERGCRDNLFVLRVMQELAGKLRIPFCLAFLDLEKAFDSLPRMMLFAVLRAQGIPSCLVAMLVNLHTDTSCSVKVKGAVGRAFETKIGVQQGSKEGTGLFNLYLFIAIRPCLEQLRQLGVEIVFNSSLSHLTSFRLADLTEKAGNETFWLYYLLFVDDTVIEAETPTKLQQALDINHTALVAFGLRINVPKSKCMHVAGLDSQPCVSCKGHKGARNSFLLCSRCDAAQHVACAGLDEAPEGDWVCASCLVLGGPARSVLKPDVTIGGQKLEWVDEFVYLGANVSSDCSLDVELGRRIALANGAFASIKRVVFQHGPDKLGQGTMSQLFNALVGSVLLYGSEVWALSDVQLDRLEAFQRRCLRVLYSNCDDAADWDEAYNVIRVPSVRTMLARRQLRWLGHLARRSDDSILRMILSGTRRGGHALSSYPIVLRGLGGIYDRLVQRFVTAETRQQYFSQLPNYKRCPWYNLTGRTVSTGEEGEEVRFQVQAQAQAAKDAWRKFCHSVHDGQ